MNSLLDFDPSIRDKIESWLSQNPDEKTKSEIQHLLQTNPQELVDAFYCNLTFGTAGLRGVMGPGTNRMNSHNIRAATQALVNYIKKTTPQETEHAVFIGYDSRHHSKEFAEEAAKVLAGNEIIAYLCKEIRPTPLVSFGCRFYHCAAAIMVTASHNPAQYNGYKVYWNDGGQVLPPCDVGIIEEYNHITDPNQITQAHSLDTPHIRWVGKEVDEAYLKAISVLQLNPTQNHEEGDKLKIVYTALHGTGITLMPQALKLWGFNNVVYVERQNEPDGDFPTAPTPNPEERTALSLGIKTLQEVDGDILIATDPDADRVGIAFKHKNNIELLNGNQIAVLCLEHICSILHSQNKLPADAAFVKSVVTTELFRVIAKSYNCACFDVLTGFKYIAKIIREWEESFESFEFIFGGEESYGYLFGTQTRDKDAIVAGVLLSEIALNAKLQGKSLLEKLYDIYRKYGVYYEQVLPLKFEESKAGKDQMAATMGKLRKTPPKEIHGLKVTQIDDYLLSQKWIAGKTSPETIDMDKTDLLTFWLSDKSKIMIRPSGTEPKIKVYCGVTEQVPPQKDVAEILKNCEQHASTLLNALFP